MIGLKGSGNYDYELEITKETDHAYYLRTPNNEEIWMPKSTFDSEGMLLEKYEDMLTEKLEEL